MRNKVAGQQSPSGDVWGAQGICAGALQFYYSALDVKSFCLFFLLLEKSHKLFSQSTFLHGKYSLFQLFCQCDGAQWLALGKLLSMLTITPSRFQTSIVFFLRNSHLISTFSLCFYPYFLFISPFLYILYSSCIPFLSVEGCRATAESSCSFNILSQ